MADAPAGGGGKISGVEILLLAVLGIGAIATLSGHPLSSSSSQPVTTATAQPAATITTPHCGITISRPVKDEHITQVVTVVGSIVPCTNDSPLDTSLTAQVVDKTGAPVSDYTHIAMNSATDTMATFATNIPITGAPAAGVGYIIFTGPTDLSTGISLTAREPIIFQY